MMGDDLVAACAHRLTRRGAQSPFYLIKNKSDVSQRGASILQRGVARALVFAAIGALARAGGDLGLGLEARVVEAQRRKLGSRAIPLTVIQPQFDVRVAVVLLRVPIGDIEQRVSAGELPVEFGSDGLVA